MKRARLRQYICLILLLSFIVGIHEGRVALWKQGQSDPWKVFPYPVSVLPRETQKQLQEGIRVDTMEDLNQLLENFLS